MVTIIQSIIDIGYMILAIKARFMGFLFGKTTQINNFLYIKKGEKGREFSPTIHIIKHKHFYYNGLSDKKQVFSISRHETCQTSPVGSVCLE